MPHLKLRRFLMPDHPATPDEAPDEAPQTESVTVVHRRVVDEQPTGADHLVAATPGTGAVTVVAPPSVVEPPSVLDQPPSVVEQPAAVEPPSVVEQPSAVDQQPNVAEQPAAVEPPSVVEPPSTAEPVSVVEPLIVPTQPTQPTHTVQPSAPRRPRGPGRPPSAAERARRRRRRALPVLGLLVVALIAVVTVVLTHTGGSVSATGVKDGAVVNKAHLADMALRVTPNGVDAASLRATLDGHSVPLVKDGASYVVKPGALPDGKHVLAVRASKSLFGSASVSRSFTVDSTPPSLTVQAPTKPVKIKDPVTVKGEVEKGATVTAKGGTLAVTGTMFTVRYATPPANAQVVATDAAGNTTVQSVTVPTQYPTNIRAVHMTGAAWAYKPLRDPVLQMIKEHRINAVQLDIKDEDGIINYPSTVPLAQQDGATAKYYNAKQVTSQLHAMGIRVIGRVVAFNDPKLADYAVAHGHSDWVIQNPDGSKYLYGASKHGFTNFANPAVRAYNEAIAVEAIKDGFDDVVYDYVRRPDGKISGMRFPGLVGTPEASIASFLKETQAKIRPLGGSLGAAAFAQAATRPKSTAQDIPMMAKYLDVVIPMEYPSHWNNGEYGVPNTYVGAHDIVYRSLKDWLKDVKGTNCVVVPWLQDENFRGTYDAAKVREEIKGARDNGIPGWLMWSAASKFTPAAYDPDATSAL